MKFIKHFEELNSETFKKAAIKLQYTGHTKRSDNMFNYIDELKSKEENKNVISVDKIYLHKFNVNSTNLGNINSYITDAKEEIEGDMLKLFIRFESINGLYFFDLIIYDDLDDYMITYFAYKKNININLLRGDRLNSLQYANRSLFKNRKDAIELKKFLLEEFSTHSDIIKNIKINQLYNN